MSKQSMEKYREVIGRLLADRVIGYHPDLARAFGGVKNAVMLSQALYWSFNPSVDNPRRDGWFFKTAEDFEGETGLTGNEQANARRDLEEIGVIETTRKGIPPKVWYRVSWNVLTDKLTAFYDTGARCIPEHSRKRNGQNVERGECGRWKKPLITTPLFTVNHVNDSPLITSMNHG